MKQYKFKILYILKKKNKRINALSRWSDYMRDKDVFNYNILKIHKDELPLINRKKLNAIIRIL